MGRTKALRESQQKRRHQNGRGRVIMDSLHHLSRHEGTASVVTTQRWRNGRNPFDMAGHPTPVGVVDASATVYRATTPSKSPCDGGRPDVVCLRFRYGGHQFVIAQRRANLAPWRPRGFIHFATNSRPIPWLREAREKFERGVGGGHPVAIAGRITAHRDMGKTQFVDLRDVTGRIQVFARRRRSATRRLKTSGVSISLILSAPGNSFPHPYRGAEFETRFLHRAAGQALRPPPAKWERLG